MDSFHTKITKPEMRKRFGLYFLSSVHYSSWMKHAALIYIGFATIVSQILLVREFLVSFYGNELTIGIVFCCWLVWVGLGSATGNKILKHKQNTAKILSFLIGLTPLITFAQILSLKYSHYFLNSTTGTYLSLVDLIGYSIAILSVGCFLWGILFTVGAKTLTANETELYLGVNKAYILESIGSAIGGLLFSFVMSKILTTFQILFLLILIAWIVAFYLASPKHIWVKLIVLFAAVLIYAVLFKSIRLFEHSIHKYQWSFINDKLTFIRSIDTKYQNLALVQLGSQYTIYADGRPIYSIPNKYSAEIFIHSILVHKINTKRVLVIGGGFNGILNELLKYPVSKVEYVEIDPALIPFAESVLSKQDQMALHYSSVNIISADGRDFLNKAGKSYDVILVDVGEPSTASLNRYYTLEFYQQSKSRLAQNGILALSIPSSADYLTKELKNMNASVLHTLKQAFRQTLIIPGDRAVFIGSNSNRSFISNPDSLANRFEASQISCEYFTKYMFEELMLPGRVQYITDILESESGSRLNTDIDPITYYFDLLLWNRYLHDDNQFFSSITRFHILGVGSVFSIILLLYLMRYRKDLIKKNNVALNIIIAGSGFISMAISLLVLLNFQVAFGSLYEMIGAMMALNMVGLAFGAILSVWLVSKYQKRHVLIISVSALIVIIILLPLILVLLLGLRLIPITFFFALFCGTLNGLLFGIVNCLYLLNSTKAGSIYASDLFGASIGALITCSVLLPILGINLFALFLLIAYTPAIYSCYLICKKE